MGTIGDLVALTTQIVKMWRDLRDPETVTSTELFNKFVKPSYDLLKEVHTDLLRVFGELEARVRREAQPSRSTLEWFQAERTARHVDRSELRQLLLPDARGTFGNREEIIALTAEYLKAVHEYFIPSDDLPTFGGRVRVGYFTYSSTLKMYKLLEYAAVWHELSQHARVAVVAEQYYEGKGANGKLAQDAIIAGILEALQGAEDNVDHGRILWKQRIASTLNYLTLSRLASRIDADESGDTYWREVLLRHVTAERERIEQALSRVQQAFMKLRAATDRA